MPHPRLLYTVQYCVINGMVRWVWVRCVWKAATTPGATAGRHRRGTRTHNLGVAVRMCCSGRHHGRHAVCHVVHAPWSLLRDHAHSHTLCTTGVVFSRGGAGVSPIVSMSSYRVLHHKERRMCMNAAVVLWSALAVPCLGAFVSMRVAIAVAYVGSVPCHAQAVICMMVTTRVPCMATPHRILVVMGTGMRVVVVVLVVVVVVVAVAVRLQPRVESQIPAKAQQLSPMQPSLPPSMICWGLAVATVGVVSALLQQHHHASRRTDLPPPGVKTTTTTTLDCQDHGRGSECDGVDGDHRQRRWCPCSCRPIENAHHHHAWHLAQPSFPVPSSTTTLLEPR